MPRSLRLVVDTNIFVSALFSTVRNRRSLERTLLEWIASTTESKAPQLVVSAEILAEYDDVFHRPEFDFGPTASQTLAILRQLGESIRPAVEIRALKDPDDTKFLEAALDGQAHYLITRNKRDYPDWSFIVTVKEFFERERPEVFQ